MEPSPVIILGAGAAGLAGARKLSDAGVPILVLEARERIGGRVYTTSAEGALPVELGAEFVHGAQNSTWEFIKAAKLGVLEVPDRHWRATCGRVSEDPQFWEHLSAVGELIPNKEMDYQSFLSQAKGLNDEAKWLAKEYVEGFHAAPVERMSVQAITKAEQSSEKEEGNRQFKLAGGYSGLIQHMAEGLHVVTNCPVCKVRWTPGAVELEAEVSGKCRVFSGALLLVTVPLGVLKNHSNPLAFEPEISQKRQAIQGLEMGMVVKVNLLMRRRFWPVENFGFIHSDDEWLPTWWVDERGPMLTGWAGGPRAEWLSREPRETIIVEAVRALSSIFSVPRSQIQDSLLASLLHDWNTDPFSLGAYSFTPVGMGAMPHALAQPVADTLFFAGEATDFEGREGTVHGAIASGQRAAEEILASLKKRGLLGRFSHAIATG